MKNIIITGANSFIGSYFKNQIKEFEIKEVCLIENTLQSIDFSSYNVVFHVAAIVHQDKSIPEVTYFKVNSDLAFDVAQKAKKDGVKQFVFMSTVKVYGENTTEEKLWTEETECLPVDAYGKSKLEAENRIMELNDEVVFLSCLIEKYFSYIKLPAGCC